MDKTNSDNQKVSVAKVIMWMTAFLLLYLPLVLLVFASVIACICGAVAGGYIMATDNIFGGIALLLIIAAVTYFLVYPFCIAILRPFFTLYNNDMDYMEITEEDAPELVALIYRIADLTGNERPVHIYVSAEFNARVFFDTKFSNIFVPVKKNIMVGLGVFVHMSVEETAACIAHEFGHFSQDRMRWGTVVYILNTLIANLMGANDRWNTVVNKLIGFPWIGGQGIVASLAFKLMGWTLYWATIGYTTTMRAIYKKIQLAHWELSRKMEFEADDAAARIVGSKVYESFMYKLIETSDIEDMFTRHIQLLASDNQLIGDYWKAFAQVDTYISDLCGYKIHSMQKLTAPLTPTTEAKLIFEDIDSTHPHWSKRVAAVKAAAYPQTVRLSGRAWDIIPQTIKNQVGKSCIDYLATLCDTEEPVSHLSDKEFCELTDERFYSYQYFPYFNRDIIPFDVNSCEPSPSFTPDDKECLTTMSRYEAAKTDYENAKIIMQSKVLSKVIYKGVPCKVSEIPIGELEQEYHEQERKAALIDKRICALALSKTHDASNIKFAYSVLFYVQQFLKEFEEFVEGREEHATALLNESHSSTNSRQFSNIQKALIELDKWFYTFGPDNMDKQFFSDCAKDEDKETIKQYEALHESMFAGDQITAESINLLFTAINCIRDLHKTYKSQVKMVILDACLGREEKKI